MQKLHADSWPTQTDRSPATMGRTRRRTRRTESAAKATHLRLLRYRAVGSLGPTISCGAHQRAGGCLCDQCRTVITPFLTTMKQLSSSACCWCFLRPNDISWSPTECSCNMCGFIIGNFFVTLRFVALTKTGGLASSQIFAPAPPAMQMTSAMGPRTTFPGAGAARAKTNGFYGGRERRRQPPNPGQALSPPAYGSREYDTRPSLANTSCDGESDALGSPVERFKPEEDTFSGLNYSSPSAPSISQLQQDISYLAGC